MALKNLPTSGIDKVLRSCSDRYITVHIYQILHIIHVHGHTLTLRTVIENPLLQPIQLFTSLSSAHFLLCTLLLLI